MSSFNFRHTRILAEDDRTGGFFHLIFAPASLREPFDQAQGRRNEVSLRAIPMKSGVQFRKFRGLFSFRVKNFPTPSY
jgi:hypothetical protein